MAEFATAGVQLWGRDVGVIVESTAGRVAFEYDPAFRASGLEISPLQMPLRRSGPIEFRELSRSPAFQGLPGVFADALPDRFGNEIIKRYFEAQGRPKDALSPVQRLLYVGDRGMGALQFSPMLPAVASTDEALEVRHLVDQARRVIEGDTTVAVSEIMQVGGSAGGARAKALVLWNREANQIRSGHALPQSNEEPWLIKFDGVTRDAGGLGLNVDGAPGPWGRIEYVYSRLARDAGIDMADTHLLRDGDLAHFMTRRFDRTEQGGRLHMHTLGGLQHVDLNNQFAFSYEAYFDTIRALRLGQGAINQAFRRMVFSVATVNYDDHVKNFAFLMDDSGAWRLSPAYDVAYAENDNWTRQHQMSVMGKFKDISPEDLTRVGSEFDVPSDGAPIIDEVREALEGWRGFAVEAGVPAVMIDFLEGRSRCEGGWGGFWVGFRTVEEWFVSSALWVLCAVHLELEIEPLLPLRISRSALAFRWGRRWFLRNALRSRERRSRFGHGLGQTLPTLWRRGGLRPLNRLRKWPGFDHVACLSNLVFSVVRYELSTRVERRSVRDRVRKIHHGAELPTHALPASE